MSKSNKVARSAIMIIILTLGSKFLGFFREMLIGQNFGSGVVTDTFFVSMTATGLVTAFISSAISTTFIPVLSEVASKEGKIGKIEHTNNMINIIFIISIFIVVMEWLAAPLIIKLTADGFEGQQFILAVKLTRIGIPMILFGGIVGVLTGYLQSEERFFATSLVGVPFNLVYIVFLIFFSSRFGIEGLMVSAVIAAASQFLILIPEILKTGYRYSFKFDIKDKYIRKVLLLSLPVLIGVAINDINAIVDKKLASRLVNGSISALNFSGKLNNLILGVFIGAITTVIFPKLAQASNSDDIKGMKKIMNYGINLILIITVPATIGMMILSTPIVQVAFEKGEFGPRATLMTAQALVFYSIGLVAMALRLLLTRVYYSLQDTKTPMINGAIAVVFNIIFNLILVRFMGHAGLALGTSISATITTLLLLYGLRKKIGTIGIRSYIITLIKTGLSASVMGVAAYLIYNGIYSMLPTAKLYNAIALFSAAGVGALIYGVLCYAFKVEEVRNVVDKVLERVRR